MVDDQHMYVHLLAGGLAGSAGTILTCPLEIVKTRLQSSTSSYQRIAATQPKLVHINPLLITQPQLNYTSTTNAVVNTSNLGNITNRAHNCSLSNFTLFKNNGLGQPGMSNMSNGINTSSKSVQPRMGLNIYLHLRFILENEGYRALFKGLAPTLVGVAPYRAIYFYTYANTKKMFASRLGNDSPVLHAASAFIAGFSSVTVTNPVWFIKTRMQLDETRGGVGVVQVAKKIFKEKGILGFYKGISASYFGIIETAIYFSIYEKLKSVANRELNDDQTYYKFLGLFGSAGFSKSLASVMCYPHEVARTRLREEGNKYTGFFQTLMVVFREEGARGLYKGMGTHLLRQIPNSMIVMVTYELIINYYKEDKSHN